jgi:hypothetical protein
MAIPKSTDMKQKIKTQATETLIRYICQQVFQILGSNSLTKKQQHKPMR